MTWVLVDNPAYEGLGPRLLEAGCHDRTPFLTVECSFCETENHIHESQIEDAPADGQLGMRCSGCRRVNVAPIAFMAEAFSDLRKAGWIA